MRVSRRVEGVVLEREVAEGAVGERESFVIELEVVERDERWWAE